MIFLIAAILFSTLNHLIFKAFDKYHIRIYPAVTANYAACVGVGLLSALPHTAGGVPRPWLGLAAVQGLLFFISFVLIGRTTRARGVAVTGLATRLAVAIPTLAAFFMFGDTAAPAKCSGIVLALVALYLSCRPGTDKEKKDKGSAWLPVWLFITFGTHATLLKYVQVNFLTHTDLPVYVMTAFFFSLCASGLVTGSLLLMGHLRIGLRDILAGAGLGCINFGAVFFLIKTLAQPGWQSSRIFPTMSISVVIFSALGARLLFSEQIHAHLIRAILVGTAAIVLING